MNVPFRRLCGLLVMLAGLGLGLSGNIFPYFVAIKTDLLLQTLAERHTQLGWALLCQALTCLCLIIAVIGLQGDPRATRSKTMHVGAILILMGTLGLGMQAWLEWVIYSSTFFGADNASFGLVTPLLQKPTRLVIPALLWFLMIGSTVYSAGFYHIDATGVGSKRLFLLALAWGLLGYYLVPAHEQTLVYHGFLFWITLAYCWLGFEICFRFRPPRPKALAPAGREHLF